MSTAALETRRIGKEVIIAFTLAFIQSKKMINSLWYVLFYAGMLLNLVPDLLNLSVPFVVRVIAFVLVSLAALLKIGYLLTQHRQIDRKKYSLELSKVLFNAGIAIYYLKFLLQERADRQLANVVGVILMFVALLDSAKFSA